MVLRYVYHSLAVLTVMLGACTGGDKGGLDEYSSILLRERSDKEGELLSKGVIEEEDLERFRGLNYYDPDTHFRVMAGIQRLPPLKVTFKTNTERAPEYYTFALLNFNIGDSVCSLVAYASDSEGKEGLFIPFRDLSNRKETYGGGRYIDLPYQGEKEYIRLDFNRAYNPYCHYNHRYSCPLVPEENRLKVAIRAGEKKLFD